MPLGKAPKFLLILTYASSKIRGYKGIAFCVGKLILVIRKKGGCYYTVWTEGDVWHPGHSLGHLLALSCPIFFLWWTVRGSSHNQRGVCWWGAQLWVSGVSDGKQRGRSTSFKGNNILLLSPILCSLISLQRDPPESQSSYSQNLKN